MIKTALALLLTATSTVFAHLERNDFLNQNVEISTVLTTSNVYQDIKITAKSLESTGNYYVTFPDAYRIDDHLAYIQIKGGSPGRSKQVLPFARAMGSENRGFYRVDFGRLYEEGQVVELEVKTIWMGRSHPYPKEIDQKKTDQKFDFNGNGPLYSCYKTEEVKHTVRLPNSMEPLSWGKDIKELNPVSRSGDKITFGPYKNVKHFTDDRFRIHFFDSNVPLVAKNYKKTVRVSYWTPELHVQEDFEVHHKGAKLKGHFSQIDYKLTQHNHGSTTVVKSMTALLPQGAKDVYYKDVVGNISTSNLRKEKTRTVLELRPRYPLYGGWKFTWFHGYTIPTYPTLQVKNSNQYTFELPMTPSVKNLYVERAFLEVILPEGAENIKVHAPYEIVKQTESKTFTYFDTIGRPTILIEKEKVIDEHYEPVKITYTYSSMNSWRKPVAIVASLIAVLIVLVTISNIDLSIIQDPALVLKKKLAVARSEISTQVLEERKGIARLNFAFSNYKSSKKLKAFEASREKFIEQIEECQSLIAKEEYAFSPELFKNCKHLSSLLKSRSENLKQTHDAVIAFFEGDTEDEDKRKKLAVNLEALENSLDVINDKITAFLTAF